MDNLRSSETLSQYLPLTPFDESDWGWLRPRLHTARPGEGIRAFCMDGYLDICDEVGHGEAARRLAASIGHFPAITVMPLSLAMLLAFSTARWFDADSELPEAIRRMHTRAVYNQMQGGAIGRPLVLAANGNFARFLENMTMFPKFSVNFGRISCSRTGPTSMTVHHDDFYTWLDTVMAATYQGLGRYFGHEDLKIDVEIHSAWTMDHHLSW